MQFFEYKHGKTKPLDQDLFNAVIQKFEQKMSKKKEVLHTSEFVEWFRLCYAEQRKDPKLYPPERLETREHHFWEWDPQEEPPRRVPRFNAVSLHLNRFWQATPIEGGLGKTRVDIQIAPISPLHSKFQLARLDDGIGFTYSMVKC